MLSSHVVLHRRLDELALEALGPPPPLPVARVPELEVSIELVWEDEAAIDELATTNRFVRFSAPYERVEIEEMPALAALAAQPRPAVFDRPRPTTFARTISASERSTLQSIAAVQASATVPFERVWFEDDEDRLASIEEAPSEQKTSWKWLAISIAAGGAAVAFMALAAG